MAQERAAAESKVITVAVPRDFANRLKVVASHHDVTMQEAIEKFFRPTLDREYRKCIEAANRELGEAGA